LKEYYPTIFERYYPEIEASLEDENPIYRFVGVYAEKTFTKNISLKGLFVFTDKNIYFRGKAKASFNKGWVDYARSGSKQFVMKYPLEALRVLKQGGSKFVIKYDLGYTHGEKYAGKLKKMVMTVNRGKDEKGKEPKEEWLGRIEEIRKFIDEAIAKNS